METKHTPEPWIVGHDEGDGTQVVTFEARDICRLETHYADAEANAQLIAAAPDLLAALADTLRHFAGFTNKAQTPEQGRAFLAALAAIAKAKGRAA